MTKDELKTRLEAAEKQNLGLLDEIKYLKAQLAKVQDEPEIPDFPEFAIGAAFWYFSSNLNDVNLGYVADTIGDDYNSFHTQKMAQEYAEKCKLIAMMLHCKWYLCRDFIPEWSENARKKGIVYYSHRENKFKADYNYIVEENNVLFDTEENAQKCADWLNAHWKEDGNGTE